MAALFRVSRSAVGPPLTHAGQTSLKLWELWQKDLLGKKMRLLIFLPSPCFCLNLSIPNWRNKVCSPAHCSTKTRISTCSRSRFSSVKKPLQTLAETRVNYNNVKYVFLTRGQQDGGVPTAKGPVFVVGQTGRAKQAKYWNGRNRAVSARFCVAIPPLPRESI
jgi:hypothetical protein